MRGKYFGLVRIALAAAFVTSACTPRVTNARTPTDPAPEQAVDPGREELEGLLRTSPELSAILDEAARRRVQVLVAIPTEDASGRRSLRRLGFRVDAEYFYPASAVKLFAAVAALEKLDEVRAANRPGAVDLSTPLRVIEGEGQQRKVLETTLRDEIEKALVVSDNEAHNRLFELVGREELAERMQRLGFDAARIVHRLADSGEAPPPAFEWLPAGAEPVYVAQRTGFEAPALTYERALVGTAHIDAAGRRVPGPMDFSGKNRIMVRDLQDLLIAVMQPELAEGNLPALAPRDREALAAILGTLPSEVRGRRHARELDDLHKPLHAAITAALPGDRVRVSGKGGRAYGFAVENSYAVDETTGRSFFVTAVFHANENGTLNDDQYEYAALAEPFITRLGQVLARAFLTGAAHRER